nr:glutamate-1-semialdehyde 2,1-aminomutase [Ardenticatena sp.]
MKTTPSIQASQTAFEAAQRLIPGGVNSPVRAFKGVGGTPRFIARGEGPYVWDIDGHRYIDYVLSWGPLIAGHAHPDVVHAICEQAQRGTSYGAPTLLETELAELVCELVPSVEMVRFVNSGTEATMSALRLARAYTGRSKIVKMQGHYHGHADFLLVAAGSGVTTLGLPDSPGVPPGVAQDTIIVPFNDLDALHTLFQEVGSEIAAVILEPVAGNMGVVPPKPGYLEGVREITAQHGALLIFDEVMTGFRVAPGGAQAYYGVMPDLTTLGKVIGGGLPVGAYGGRREIMQMVAPAGPMYQAGTLSGNPLAMVAGLTTLRLMVRPGAFDEMVARTARLAQGMLETVRRAGLPATGHQVGTMFSLFFTETNVVDYTTAKTSDTALYARFFHALLDRGVYLAPSQFEAAFISLVHDDAVIEATLDAVAEVAATLATE